MNELPEQFVLKTNHGSGFNIIVEKKENCNLTQIKNNLTNWMKIDYGEFSAEYHYSFIKKKIFAGEYIGNNKNYKFLCYNGTPKYIYVSISDNHTKYRNFYDINWNFLNISCLSTPHPTNIYQKPKFFLVLYIRNIRVFLDNLKNIFS